MPGLTIISHNIFWGQGAGFTSLPPPENPDPLVWDKLRELYLRERPDILCLQELQNRDCADDLALKMNKAVAFCPGRKIPYYGGGIYSSLEMTGLADCRGTAPPVQRMWQSVEVTGPGIGVVICNLHLPSARQYGAERAAQVRLEELQAVLSQERRPDIITGDFNEKPGQGVTALMESRGYDDPAELTGNEELETTAGGSRSDYIWIKRPLSRFIKDYRVLKNITVTREPGKKESISDHRPIRITLDFPKG